MILGNKNKLVLCATTDRLLAGIWRTGKLQAHQVFLNDEAGHQAFSVFLAQFPETPVYLIADAVEEDYRLESVPHATGTAKRELIDRKLNQFYRGLVYRTAHFVNRETDKRKDDRFLFVALNNDEFLRDWVSAIQSVEVQLVGIYLLPMLSQMLVQQLKLTSPHVLLCEKSSSGLRQTYLHNGSIRMSRLVPNLPSEVNQHGYFYLDETEKTRLYLISQRYITRETPLNLLLVSVDGSMQEISQGISQESGLVCSDVNLSQLAVKQGLSLDLLHKMPELMHMQLLASGQLVDNLAPAPLTKQYQFGKIKQTIKLATIMLGLLGLSAAALQLKHGLAHYSELTQATQDTMVQQQRYDVVAKNFPVTQIGAEDLKTAVELDKTIAAFPKSPRLMMQVVSTALEKSSKEKFDNVQLNRLHWVLTNDINIKDDDKISAQPATNVQPNPSPVPTTDPTKLYELGFVNAEITGFTGDYRAALNTVNRLVENLKADNRVAAVELLQAPVNMSSYVDLQGSTTDEQSTQKQPALFKLKVILKAPDAVEVKQP
jgi:hypothetical protein